MASKQEKAGMIQAFKDAEVDFTNTETRTGLRQTSAQLAKLSFDTLSACGSVTVTHNGASQLVKVSITDEALTEYDSRRIADVIERTIQKGERSVREALQHVAGKGASV